MKPFIDSLSHSNIYLEQFSYLNTPIGKDTRLFETPVQATLASYASS